ncbi:MAG: hypothetical protein AVDCRST_MAG67-559, partial [uncultured Solirubrobacteraceae bacterium]
CTATRRRLKLSGQRSHRDDVSRHFTVSMWSAMNGPVRCGA